MRNNDSDYTILQECLLIKRVLPQKEGGPGQVPLTEALTMRMVGNWMARIFGFRVSIGSYNGYMGSYIGLSKIWERKSILCGVQGTNNGDSNGKENGL